ncbi:hypothetical protein [Sutcliffiella rhizosphaerae]|uniref:Uncharacterized protein n=1 Tax=Sutcliffiella rhizosphaerae TaxID=2880967 RepID=A0ABM8YPT5_9BACI|nr:hypothetical protein [Sutcliffiella rhizosphaerae]CAG9622018.1 hypothetical protein BACCIP111883_02809 [Sutcliffiella rhizosphaerae]
MFDPSVFDNLKVVMEGDIYELDLLGMIKVVGRSDIVDLANMSRSFKMELTKDKNIFGHIQLSSDIENISGELLHKINSPGCIAQIKFTKPLQNHTTLIVEVEQWQSKLQHVWPHRQIIMKVVNTFSGDDQDFVTAEIVFDRLIYEENIDDLREMVNVLVTCL